MDLFEFTKGEFICESGMDMEYLFFLVEGETKVFTLLENGKTYLLRVEEPLTVYGDIEIFRSDIYSANVVALTSCLCIGLPAGFVRQRYLDHPPFLRFLCEELGHRLHTISYKSTEDIYMPLINKFAGYLLIHLEKGSDTLVLPSGFGDISEQLGVTYRHLSRVIRQLQEEGTIGKNGREVCIKNMERLRELGGKTFRY